MAMEPLEPVPKLSPTLTLGSGSNGDQMAASAHMRTWCGYFRMPLHYPRYTKADYDAMPEWKLDFLLKEYGLPIFDDIEQKRNFAIGSFLWQC